MKIYRVGGSVRDELLGLSVKDRDYVVVGATPDAMEALGFQPVGKDFPVFLHPQTHEEYALARTERKSGRGYKGFTVHAEPEVTLEEDLARRDLTINSMALDESGALIDPFGGAADLRNRVLRHVSPAFIEDPVRILRVARFAARFQFAVAEETMALMRHMVDIGEVDHLVPERVWQEFSRGLMEAKPSLMLTTLDACGALRRVLPELHDSAHLHTAQGAELLAALDRAANSDVMLPIRFAIVTHRSGARVETLADRMRASTECRDLALLTTQNIDAVRDAMTASSAQLVATLRKTDAFRRPDRFAELLNVVSIEEGVTWESYPPATRLHKALQAAQSVNAGEIAAKAAAPDRIAQDIDAARIAAVDRALS